MRHQKKHLKLGRSRSHRKAILSNLATELFKHGMIKTTYAKAKACSRFSERLITQAKKQTLSSYRYIISHLKDKEVAKKLFSDIKESIEKKGGYTRVFKLPPRQGDNSPQAIITLKGLKK